MVVLTDRLAEIEAWLETDCKSDRVGQLLTGFSDRLREAIAIARRAMEEAAQWKMHHDHAEKCRRIERERAEKAEADYKSSAQSAIDLGSYWEMRAAKLRGQRDEARAEAEALRAAKDEIAQQLDETTLERDELRSEAWNLRMERNALQQHVESGHGCRHSPEVFTRVRATLAGTAKAEQTHDDRGEPSPDERRTAAKERAVREGFPVAVKRCDSCKAGTHHKKPREGCSCEACR